MEYYERNKEAIAEEKERLARATAEYGVEVPLLFCLAGSTMVRILPAYGTEGKFFKQVYKHWVPTSTRPAIVACPKSMAQLPCPICDKGKEFMESRDENLMKVAREKMKPRQQYLYNVICMSGPTNREGTCPNPNIVYVLEVGFLTHQQIISLDQDEALGWANVSDPNAGITLSINRTGQGKNDTKYAVNPTGAGRTSIFEELASRGVDPHSLSLYNLDEVYTLQSIEKLTEIANDVNVGGPAAAMRQDQPTFKPAPVTVPPVSQTPTMPPPFSSGFSTTMTPPPATPVPQPTTAPVPVPQPIGTGGAPAQPVSPPTAEPVIPDPPVTS
jgi:hypothetical protein